MFPFKLICKSMTLVAITEVVFAHNTSIPHTHSLAEHQELIGVVVFTIMTVGSLFYARRKARFLKIKR